MAFKLTRTESKQRADLIADLQLKQDAFEAAKGIDMSASDLDNLKTKLAEFLVTLSEAEDFQQEVSDRFREEFDNRSDKWQESDAGDEASQFIDEWENADFSEPALDDPQDLELDNYAEILESLPEEVE